MKQLKWIFFISVRYLTGSNRKKSFGPSFLAVAGISIGVMALISVLGVMNGFQLGFIEDIININSFHIRVYSNTVEPEDNILTVLRSIDEIETVLPFMDIQTLIKGEFTDYEAVNIRAVPGNIREYDPSMADQLQIIAGSEDLDSSNSIILGNQLAQRLGVGIGASVSLVSMEGSNFRNLIPSEEKYHVSGIFQSGYYSFDRTMGFTLVSGSKILVSGKEKVIYGIKLKDKYRDREVLRAIEVNLDSTYSVVSWRDFNSSFFGALKTEKTAMLLVIGLIFIVVGVNIKHSLERSVVERKEEIGIMISLGASPGTVKTIFVIEGFLIGLTGSVTGLLSGLFITGNINFIFSVIDTTVKWLISIIEIIISPFSGGKIIPVSMFSSSNFYISEVPVRIIYSELLFIFLFAVLSSTWAAYSASKMVSIYKPSEVLRFE